MVKTANRNPSCVPMFIIASIHFNRSPRFDGLTLAESPRGLGGGNH